MAAATRCKAGSRVLLRLLSDCLCRDLPIDGHQHHKIEYANSATHVHVYMSGARSLATHAAEPACTRTWQDDLSCEPLEGCHMQGYAAGCSEQVPTAGLLHHIAHVPVFIRGSPADLSSLQCVTCQHLGSWVDRVLPLSLHVEPGCGAEVGADSRRGGLHA